MSDTTGWRPIEEAPRDGTPVLVWLAEPSLGSHIHAATFHEGKSGVIGHHFAYDVGRPTHWMPLPEPPEE